MLRLFFLGFFDGCQQLVRIFFFSDQALFDQLIPIIFQSKDICHIFQISLAYQFYNIILTKTLNVHSISAHKIDNMAFLLSRAADAGTLDICRLFLSHCWCSTYRTPIRDLESDGACRSFFFYHRLDLRNNLSGFIHYNRISNTDIQIINKILVMQCGSGYAGTTQANRIKNRRRCDSSSTSYGQFDIPQHSLFFLWWIFISHCPSWYLGCLPHRHTILQIIQLHHCTINIISQFSTLLTDLLNRFPDFFACGADLIIFNHFHAIAL